MESPGILAPKLWGLGAFFWAAKFFLTSWYKILTEMLEGLIPRYLDQTLSETLSPARTILGLQPDNASYHKDYIAKHAPLCFPSTSQPTSLPSTSLEHSILAASSQIERRKSNPSPVCPSSSSPSAHFGSSPGSPPDSSPGSPPGSSLGTDSADYATPQTWCLV